MLSVVLWRQRAWSSLTKTEGAWGYDSDTGKREKTASPRMRKKLRVLFAPDYRAGTPYQTYLAEALERRGMEVMYLDGYRRGLPLARGVAAKKPDLLHLHWPEDYFREAKDGLDRLRVLRYPLDLLLTSRQCPIVWTAHNLLPHNRGKELGVSRAMRATANRASAIFVHSDAARDQVSSRLRVDDKRIQTIPFGDHAIAMGKPVERAEARKRLGLPIDQKVCLVFGVMSPYKGTDEIVRLWKKASIQHRLVVVGPVLPLEWGFVDELQQIAFGTPQIDIRPSTSWLDDPTLHLYLSAADCTIFNYRQSFSSGAAALARSYGLPIVIPKRLTTVELGEPHYSVFRFEDLSLDFASQLERAVATSYDYQAAQAWRDSTSWDQVADITSRMYLDVLGR